MFFIKLKEILQNRMKCQILSDFFYTTLQHNKHVNILYGMFLCTPNLKGQNISGCTHIGWPAAGDHTLRETHTQAPTGSVPTLTKQRTKIPSYKSNAINQAEASPKQEQLPSVYYMQSWWNFNEKHWQKRGLFKPQAPR